MDARTGVLDVVGQPEHERVVDELGEEEADGIVGNALGEQSISLRQHARTAQHGPASLTHSLTGIARARMMVTGWASRRS